MGIGKYRPPQSMCYSYELPHVGFLLVLSPLLGALHVQLTMPTTIFVWKHFYRCRNRHYERPRVLHGLYI